MRGERAEIVETARRHLAINLRFYRKHGCAVYETHAVRAMGIIKEFGQKT